MGIAVATRVGLKPSQIVARFEVNDSLDRFEPIDPKRQHWLPRCPESRWNPQVGGAFETNRLRGRLEDHR